MTAQKTKLSGTVRFSQRNPDALATFALVDEDILKAASVGYDVQKAGRVKPEQRKRGDDPDTFVMAQEFAGFHFVETELMECSIVGVGADRDSLRKAQDRGHVGGQKLTRQFRQWIADMAPAPVWSPGVSFSSAPVTRTSAETSTHNLPSAASTHIDSGTVTRQNPNETDTLSELLSGVASMAQTTHYVERAVRQAISPVLAQLSQRLDHIEQVLPRRGDGRHDQHSGSQPHETARAGGIAADSRAQ